MSKFWPELKVKAAGGKFLKFFHLCFLVSLPFGAQADPPDILVQPGDLSVQSRSAVEFSVAADGTQPLSYQWQFNGRNIAGATSSNLFLASVLFTNGGSYQVRVSNADGAVTSRAARLDVDTDLTFRILNLTTNNLLLIDEQPYSGYCKGGLGVSSNYVLVAGRDPSSTAIARASRHSLNGLNDGASISGNCDAIVCNLRSGKLYVLGNGSNPITFTNSTLSTNRFSALLEIDDLTGLPTGNQILLSTNIPISNSRYYMTVFSGYDRIVIGSAYNYHIYDIALPSGQVTDLGSVSSSYLYHCYSYTWTYFGLVEYVGNTLYLIYLQSDDRTLVRRQIPGGATSPLLTFTDAGYMESLGFSLKASRWYFHISYGSQFSSYNSTLGTAKATYTTDPGYPSIINFPGTVKVYVSSNAQFSVAASGVQPLTYQWLFNGAAIPNATNDTLLLTNVQPTDAGYYSVQVGNLVGLATSPQALLDVVAAPRVNSWSGARAVMAGTNTTISVNWEGSPPVSLRWQLNGTNLPPWATNSSLTLTNIQPSQGGMYTLFLSNQYGTLVSSQIEVFVFAPEDDGSAFQVTSLTTNNVKTIETYDMLGYYEYGPIAASANSLFFSSYSYYDSARVNIDDLTGLGSINRYNYGLISNLRSEKAYLLGTADGPPESSSLSTATRLWEIDSQTGAPNGNYADLSMPISNLSMYYSIGFFSGYDRAIVLNGSRAYNIALPSGIVTDLGPMSVPAHPNSYGSGIWGVAEHFDGLDYILYARNSTAISRARVPDGVVSTVSTFANLSSYMNSITVSIRRGRWYFQHLYNSQFAPNNSSTLGYANATFNINSGSRVDHFEWAPMVSPILASTPFPVTIYAKNTTNAIITGYSNTAYLSGIALPAGTNVPVGPISATFTNGTWSGMAMVFQANTNVVLQADDREGHYGLSGNFRVIPTNDLSLAVSANPSPVVGGQYLTYSLRVSNTGPAAVNAVMVTNSLTGNFNFISATTSQGSCSNVNKIIFCNLGTVSSNVEIAMVIQPTTTGTLFSRASVWRPDSDPDTGNNTALLVTSVVLPILTIQDARQAEGNNGTNLMTFNVTLFPATNTTVSVNYATGNGTAFSTGTYPDFAGVSGTLTFPPNSTNQTLTVPIIGDTIFELDETFTVTLTSPSNASLGRAQGIGTILNDDPMPTLTISDVALNEGNSGTTNAIFNISLSTMTGAGITVAYITSNGTATAGSDYVATTNGTLIFGAESDTLRTISVPINCDTNPEPNETFYLILTGVTNAIPLRTNALCTIVNDDGIGLLDHFTWSTIGSPQRADAPFTVAISAKDFWGNILTNFNTNMNFYARRQQAMLGDIPATNSFTNNLFTLGYAFVPTNDILVTDFRHLSGTKVSLWISNSAALLATKQVSGVPGVWTTTPLDSPVTLLAGETYVLAFCGGTEQIYYYGGGIGTNFPNGVIAAALYTPADGFPTNYLTLGNYYLVDLAYAALGTSNIVPCSPTNANFANGQWQGTVTVQAPSTNTVLLVDDGAGRYSSSNPFDVLGAYYNYVHFQGQQIQIGFHGILGARYRLDRSEQLNSDTWVLITEFTLQDSPNAELTDSMPTNSPTFYRFTQIAAP